MSKAVEFENLIDEFIAECTEQDVQDIVYYFDGRTLYEVLSDALKEHKATTRVLSELSGKLKCSGQEK